MLNIPVDKEMMTWIVAESCRRNNLRNGYIRLIVTRGHGTLGLEPWVCVEPSIICIAASIKLYPSKYYQKGLEICTVSTRRNMAEILNPRLKSLNYLNNVLAKIEAHNAGCSEALMLDAQGFVNETSGQNIFLVKDGQLLTPPVYLGALKGITRSYVIELAEREGITILRKPFTRLDVFTADEVFLTGTAAEIVPVVSVDKRTIGSGKPGEITKTLMKHFKDRVTVDGVHIDKVSKKPPMKWQP